MVNTQRAISPEMNDKHASHYQSGAEAPASHPHRPAAISERYPTRAPTVRSTSDCLKLSGSLIIAISV